MLDTFHPVHDSPMRRFDNRVRLLIGLGLSVCIALLHRLDAAAGALLLGVLVMLIARVPLQIMRRRLAALNLFVIVLAITLTLSASRAGLERAGLIALKANAIVTLFLGMLAAMSLVSFGHALEHLRLPPRFTLLFMLAVRYTDVVRQESQRLLRAMKARGFHPGFNRHTWHTFGYLVGMLLARSFDRGSRVLGAMKCRGFVHAHDHTHRAHAGLEPRLGWHDWTLAAAAVAAGVLLIGWPWR